jgi:hypothetical protein
MSDSNDKSNPGGNEPAGQLGITLEVVRAEVWLDLEDTLVTPIVDGWHLFEIINLEKIKRVIADLNPVSVSIFSFAIWNEHQRNLFNRHTRPHLEAAIGRRFEIVPTVDDDIIPVCANQMGIAMETVDFQEMSNFWGKQGAFRLWMRDWVTRFQRHQPILPFHAVLLDDAVYNEKVEWPDLRATIEQWNIDQL